MRHRKAGLKLSRKTGHLNAMFRNLVTSLFKHDRIRTTDTKAKELRRWADHLVTLAKRGDLHARRQALAILREADVVRRLFENAAERFGAVAGGYTRLAKLGPRPGDAAPMTLVELIGARDDEKKKKKKKKKGDAAPAKAEVGREKGASGKAAPAAPAPEAAARPDAAPAAKGEEPAKSD